MNAKLQTAKLDLANAEGVDFSEANLSSCSLERCTLVDAKFQAEILNSAKLVEVKAQRADFASANHNTFIVTI